MKPENIETIQRPWKPANPRASISNITTGALPDRRNQAAMPATPASNDLYAVFNATDNQVALKFYCSGQTTAVQWSVVGWSRCVGTDGKEGWSPRVLAVVTATGIASNVIEPSGAPMAGLYPAVTISVDYCATNCRVLSPGALALGGPASVEIDCLGEELIEVYGKAASGTVSANVLYKCK